MTVMTVMIDGDPRMVTCHYYNTKGGHHDQIILSEN